MSATKFYRAEGISAAPDFTAGLATLSGYEQEVFFYEFPVIKLTPKGCKVNAFGVSKFIHNDSHKKYAWPTKEEALTSYIRRKEIYVDKLATSLEIAKEQLKAGILLKESGGSNETN